MGRLILIALLLLITACNPQLAVQAPKQALNPVPSAQIIVIRSNNFYGGGLHYWVTLDHEPIAGLRPDQYTEFNTPAGEHSVGVKWIGSWKFVFWNTREIKENFQPGQIYYFLLSPTVLGTTEIERISEKEGKKKLLFSTQIPAGTVGAYENNRHRHQETKSLAMV